MHGRGGRRGGPRSGAGRLRQPGLLGKGSNSASCPQPAQLSLAASLLRARPRGICRSCGKTPRCSGPATATPRGAGDPRALCPHRERSILHPRLRCNGRAVGPNKVIKSVPKGRNATYPKTLPTGDSKVPTGDAEVFQTDRSAGSDPDPILRMLEATFLSLNESNPNLTESCWLCYDAKPPFYEGVALNTPFSYSTADAPQQCRWETPRKGITLSQVTGQGRCFGNATLARRRGNVCTKVVQPNRKNSKWVVPSAPGMWVCQRSGVSPCVSLAKFDDSNDFCLQVLIVPRVLYHSDEEVYHLFEEPSRLHKREIITGVTIAMLLGLGAAGTATGVSALATQHQGLSQLQMTIDEDLQRIEKSISFLEKSVSSLSEVVLQNRRGLDLLFMQQGGLCAALREECCFYADHTGVVRDSMTELRNRLAQRQKDREAQQGWFESWFNQSPWLTTLISTLIGPLALLLLAVTFGPCLLNKLVSFIQTRLEQANILFISRRIQPGNTASHKS